ncbi:hypothetical protein ACWPM1_14375 [Tsuneonella sp. HG249]
MSFWTAAVVIVAIIAFTSIRIAALNRRNGIGPDLAQPTDDGEKALLRHEVQELRERIKVLERITTDANTSHALETRRVSDEIEALRDR